MTTAAYLVQDIYSKEGHIVFDEYLVLTPSSSRLFGPDVSLPLDDRRGFLKNCNATRDVVCR